MRNVFICLTTWFSIFLMSVVVMAMPIQDEAIIDNPSSTDNLWAYSYQNYASYISSASDYVTSGDPYRDAIFQGYVTGDNGPWSSFSDSWSSNGLVDPNSRTVHVFDTYISSAINQTVTFTASGDDGKSFFVNDTFLNGSGYYPASNQTTATLNMIANTEYKLTYIGSNYTREYAWWFKMSGDGWAGPVSEASNIDMNANASNPVPEPATMLLFGAGLIGVIGSRIKRKKK